MSPAAFRSAQPAAILAARNSPMPEPPQLIGTCLNDLECRHAKDVEILEHGGAGAARHAGADAFLGPYGYRRSLLELGGSVLSHEGLRALPERGNGPSGLALRDGVDVALDRAEQLFGLAPGYARRR